MATFNQEHAIARYNELMRSVRAGAYDEREPDGEYGADGIERDIDNLDYQAALQGLRFIGSDDDTFTLEPMSAEDLAAFNAAQQDESKA